LSYPEAVKIPAGLKPHIEQWNKCHSDNHQRQKYNDDGEGRKRWLVVYRFVHWFVVPCSSVFGFI
jgi:hypothetical protein